LRAAARSSGSREYTTVRSTSPRSASACTAFVTSSSPRPAFAASSGSSTSSDTSSGRRSRSSGNVSIWSCFRCGGRYLKPGEFRGKNVLLTSRAFSSASVSSPIVPGFPVRRSVVGSALKTRKPSEVS
jgi:hypothetical protein